MYSVQLNTVSSLIIILSVFNLASSHYGKPHYIVNRYDIDQPVVFDLETGTPYKNCGGSASIIKSVEIIPCDEISGGHCVIKRGDNVTCNVSFESEENSNTLTAKIYGIIAFVPVPFPCPQVKKQYYFIFRKNKVRVNDTKILHVFFFKFRCDCSLNSSPNKATFLVGKIFPLTLKIIKRHSEKYFVNFGKLL